MLKWLSADLKNEIRDMFEPLYDRVLDDDEINEVANGLVTVVEVYAKNEYERTE